MYNLEFTAQDIQLISDIIKEVPYKIAKPLLDKIASQIEKQNSIKLQDLDNNQEQQNG